MGCKIINEYRLRMRQSDVFKDFSKPYFTTIKQQTLLQMQEDMFFFLLALHKKKFNIWLIPIFDDQITHIITRSYFVNRQNKFFPLMI